MKSCCSRWFLPLFLGVVLAPLALFAQPELEAEFPVEKMEEEADFARWYVSPGVGWALFEGDEPLRNGPYLTLRLGYDFGEWWSAEGSLLLAPKLDENLRGWDVVMDDGILGREKVSKSKGITDFGDTYMVQAYGDALFHFTRWERLDPYLALGSGVTFFGEDVMGDRLSVTLRGGGGVLYHFNEEWGLRADVRVNLAGYNTEFNATLDFGVVWTWGAGRFRAE